jgi:hypothetical protein
MACAWIGVKVLNWDAASFCCNAAESGSSVKLVIRFLSFLRGLLSRTHAGVPLPLTSHLDLALNLSEGRKGGGEADPKERIPHEQANRTKLP